MCRMRWKKLLGCEGAALLEFAVACMILVPMLFGFIEVCMAFYAYNFVSDAAREATRYAIVRGSKSCGNLPNPGVQNCNFTTAAPLQTFVQSLGYPGLKPGNLVVTVAWSRASTSTPTSWTACGTACNQPGNQVQVKVRYNFPIGIPYWRVTTVSIGSVSSMVIAQ